MLQLFCGAGQIILLLRLLTIWSKVLDAYFDHFYQLWGFFSKKTITSGHFMPGMLNENSPLKSMKNYD